MKNNTKKERVPVWLEPQVIKKLESLLKIENADNLSQLIAKAVDFYLGYVGTNDATQFLSETLVGVVDSSIKQTESRQALNLFRIAVELNIAMQILGSGLDLSDTTMEKVRANAIKSVKQTNGKVRFEQVLDEVNGGYDAEDYF